MQQEYRADQNIFDRMGDFFSRHYHEVQPDGNIYTRKGLIDQVRGYQIRVNAGDHEPPHIHVSVNNVQVGSYYIETGQPYRTKNKDHKIDTLVELWFRSEANKKLATDEWHRMTGR